MQHIKINVRIIFINKNISYNIDLKKLNYLFDIIILYYYYVI